MFIQKLPSQSWKRPDLIAQTTSITITVVVRTHPAALQWGTSCLPHLVLLTHIHYWWIPGTHYRRASNRGCIKSFLLQSSVRSNMRRTQCLPWSPSWKQQVLTMLFILTIWPQMWHMRSLRSEALTQTSRRRTIAWMTNFISGCQGAAGIVMIKVTKATSAMPSLPPAGEHGRPLNSRGLTWEPAISMGMRAGIARIRMRMSRKKHRKPMMDQRRMRRTEGM